MKRSKRYDEQSQKVDKDKLYPLAEALKLAKETANTKFDSSVEAHIRLGIDTKKSDQLVRGAVVLPHGIGKTVRIAAFVSPDKEADAKSAGADLVGGEDMIEELKRTGKIDFEVALATPDMMPKLAVVAKVLGPRGLMPSPKNDTVTTDVKKTIEELKKGKISFKNDDTANIHQSIGKTSFTEAQLTENYETFIDAVKKAKPQAAKGTYIKNISLSTTMGPGIRVEL